MKMSLQVVFSAMALGLLAYAGVCVLWPQIPPGDFGNLIGVIALLGAVLGSFLDKLRKPPADKASVQGSGEARDG